MNIDRTPRPRKESEFTQREINMIMAFRYVLGKLPDGNEPSLPEDDEDVRCEHCGNWTSGDHNPWCVTLRKTDDEGPFQ